MDVIERANAKRVNTEHPERMLMFAPTGPPRRSMAAGLDTDGSVTTRYSGEPTTDCTGRPPT